MYWNKFKEYLLLLLLLIFYGYAEEYQDEVDYCNLNGCGKDHIACKNYGDVGPDCNDTVRFASLISYRQYILDVFNELRNEIASGLEEPFKPAQRMATMQWDGDLADLAMLRTLRCTPSQDECFSTKKYINPGQEAIWYIFKGTDDVDSYDTGIKKALKSVVNFYKQFNVQWVDAMPSPQPNPLVGHFALVIRENSAFIGCAASIFTKDDEVYLMLVCNYSYTNFVGRPIYRTGLTASKCNTGTNKNFTSLCSPQEVYDFSEKGKLLQ